MNKKLIALSGIIIGCGMMYPSISLMVREEIAGKPLTNYGLISPTVLLLMFGILVVLFSIYYGWDLNE